MRPLTILGILLVVFGLIVLITEGISYTKTEKVIDIPPIEATVKRQKTVEIPRQAAGAIVVAGLLLVIAGAHKRV